jgi:3D (Asp-Asp-Asp) domain-containing protein
VLTYYGSHKVLATAYTHTDPGCDFITATGTTVRIGTVAVDPTLIPYGTRMFIVTDDGQYIYGIATAEDCGGGIKGDRIDLYFPTYDECMEFGRRPTTIYFLG